MGGEGAVPARGEMVEEASMSIRCGGDGVDVDGSDLVGRGRCRWIRCGGDGVDVDGDPIGRRRRRGRTVAAAGGVVEDAPWGWMQTFTRAKPTRPLH
jgi:hypothetical protein